jgi:hypothetical protein
MPFSLRSPVFAAAFAVAFVTFPLIGRSSPDSPKDGGVTITRVYTGWKEGSSFKRISEYFSGKENTGGTIVLRTHPDQRSGFYFLVRASNPGAPVVPVKIKVELITPTDTKPKTYTFSTDLKSGQNLLDLGLTADDWPDAKANPVAWKIDFLGSGDSLLASEKSYLWERPVTK